MNRKPVILAIDRNKTNLGLLRQFLEKHGYQVVPASTLEDVDRALLGPEKIQLALVDIAGFDRGIWERCERFRFEHIPFLVISPQQQAEIQEESIEHGARGMLVKPLAQRELLGLMNSLLGEEEE